MKKMKIKKKNIPNTIIYVLRLISFFLFPAIFATAFFGVKSIFIQVGKRESIQNSAFIVTLVVVCLFTIVCGRFFCGFCCSFGTLGDVVYELSSWVQKKRKKKPLSISLRVGEYLNYLKYIILAGIIFGCMLIKTDWVSAYSPWMVFSRMQSLALPQVGIGLVLLLIILVGMAVEKRFFCRFLCPMGAIFSLLPILPISAVRRNRTECIKGCSGCVRVCPSNLEIADKSQQDHAGMGECFSCGDCIGVCPKQHIETGLVKKKNQVFYWNLIRFGLFFLVFTLLNLWIG